MDHGTGDNDQDCPRLPLAHGPIQSISGWVLFVTGLHEEMEEDDVFDAFSDHGHVSVVKIDRDRRTGISKGYAFVEFSTRSQAQNAINRMHGTILMGKKITVDWAFVRPPGCA